MLTIFFWVLLLLVLYSYFLYPIILFFLARRWMGEDVGETSTLSVSLIVTAYNEERRIREKIKNVLELDYQHGDLELIVASDCSEDKTDEIVREYADQGVVLVRAEERLGKENAQLTAIRSARGEILVFSDTATEMPADSLNKLVQYFRNPDIGAISSEDRFVSRAGKVAGEGAYVKYEMWLRKQESRLAGLVGLSGSFFAARKEICEEWDIHSPSDFNTALNSARAGLRAVTAPDVLGYYQDLADPAKEYARKIRTVIRGMTGLARHADVLNPFKFGLFAFQVWSHKLMRWLVPWFMLAFFIVNAMIALQGGFYLLVFLGQLAFYALAMAAHFSERLRNVGPIRIIYFFVQVNVALFDAACQFLAGKRMTTWKPSAR